MNQENHPGLSGILKWSIQYHDGTRPSEVTKMTEERKKFLIEVFDSMVADHPKQIRQIMNQIHSVVESGKCDDSDGFDDNLNLLCDIVESVDMAQLFVQMGGTEDLVLLCNNDSLVLKAVSCIATLCQNHPFVQASFLKKGAFPKLLSLATDQNNRIEIHAKCLNALSCLIRGLAEVELEFVNDVATFLYSSMLQSVQMAFVSNPSEDVVKNGLKIAVKILFLSAALASTASSQVNLSCLNPAILLAIEVISSLRGGEYWLSERFLSQYCEGFGDLLEQSVNLIMVVVNARIMSSGDNIITREVCSDLCRISSTSEEYSAILRDMQNCLQQHLN